MPEIGGKNGYQEFGGICLCQQLNHATLTNYGFCCPFASVDGIQLFFICLPRPSCHHHMHNKKRTWQINPSKPKELQPQSPFPSSHPGLLLYNPMAMSTSHITLFKIKFVNPLTHNSLHHNKALPSAKCNAANGCISEEEKKAVVKLWRQRRVLDEPVFNYDPYTNTFSPVQRSYQGPALGPTRCGQTPDLNQERRKAHFPFSRLRRR